MADGVTGRRRRQTRGTVLEVMCDGHPAPQMLIRPALDERGLTLTGDQGAVVARATNQGTEPGAGARFQLTPRCDVCGATPRWRAEKVLTLLASLPTGVWRVNVHEMEVMISSPEHAATYLEERMLRSSVIGSTAPRE
jgi:hypothetical protein